MIGQMFNLRTGETDNIETPPTDYRDYIPQSAPAQNLYTVLIAQGKTPLDAAHEILAFVNAIHQEGQP